MKEFCIEINESQPLEKVEAVLKEMGCSIAYRSKLGATLVIVYGSEVYGVYTFPYNGESPLLTLEEL